MKKKTTFILIFLSSFSLCQSWGWTEYKQKTTYSEIDDEFYNKKARKNEDTQYVLDIINKSAFFYNFFNQSEDDIVTNNRENSSFGPGAPGEPLPIDKYKVILFLIGLMLIIGNKRIRRKSLKKLPNITSK